MHAKTIKQSFPLVIYNQLANYYGSTSNSTHVARLDRFTGTHICSSEA